MNKPLDKKMLREIYDQVAVEGLSGIRMMLESDFQANFVSREKFAQAMQLLEKCRRLLDEHAEESLYDEVVAFQKEVNHDT